MQVGLVVREAPAAAQHQRASGLYQLDLMTVSIRRRCSVCATNHRFIAQRGACETRGSRLKSPSVTEQVQLHGKPSRYQADVADLSRVLSGRAFARGVVGYESARFGAVVNGRKPERYPDVVVQAASATDVVAAVTFTRDRGMKLGVRSGGHSWSASFCREGGML